MLKDNWCIMKTLMLTNAQAPLSLNGRLVAMMTQKTLLKLTICISSIPSLDDPMSSWAAVTTDVDQDLLSEIKKELGVNLLFLENTENDRTKFQVMDKNVIKCCPPHSSHNFLKTAQKSENE